MKSQRAIAYLVFAAVIGIGMIGLRAAWAQDSDAAPKTTGTPTKTIVVPDADAIRKSVERELAAAGLHVGDSMDAKIRKAAEKLRDAKDDQTKATAQQKLAELLGQYFDQDMARREKELENLQERIVKLRAQLDRRRAKKQDIIDLQIQVAVNEADGLGFMSRPMNGPFHWGPNFPPGFPFVNVSHGDASVTVPMPPTPPNPQPFGGDEEATE